MTDKMQKALPTITEADRSFLHYNPNTDDLVDWVQEYAMRAVQAAKSVPVVGEVVAEAYVYEDVDGDDILGLRLLREDYPMQHGERLYTAPTATSITQAELDALREEVIKLRKLAYIGEHEFDDCTYKFRLEELAPQVRAKDARIKELETALFEVAHSRNLTATPTQWADHLQRTAKAAIAKERQS